MVSEALSEELTKQYLSDLMWTGGNYVFQLFTMIVLIPAAQKICRREMSKSKVPICNK